MKGVNVGWEQSRRGKIREMAADQVSLRDLQHLQQHGKEVVRSEMVKPDGEMQWKKYFKAILLLSSQRHALHSHIFPITFLFLVIYFALLISVPLW